MGRGAAWGEAWRPPRHLASMRASSNIIMTNNVGDLHARRQQQRLQLGKSKLVSFCLLKTFIAHTRCTRETWNITDETIIKRIRYEIATEQQNKASTMRIHNSNKTVSFLAKTLCSLALIYRSIDRLQLTQSNWNLNCSKLQKYFELLLDSDTFHIHI